MPPIPPDAPFGYVSHPPITEAVNFTPHSVKVLKLMFHHGGLANVRSRPDTGTTPLTRAVRLHLSIQFGTHPRGINNAIENLENVVLLLVSNGANYNTGVNVQGHYISVIQYFMHRPDFVQKMLEARAQYIIDTKIKIPFKKKKMKSAIKKASMGVTRKVLESNNIPQDIVSSISEFLENKPSKKMIIRDATLMERVEQGVQDSIISLLS